MKKPGSGLIYVMCMILLSCNHITTVPIPEDIASDQLESFTLSNRNDTTIYTADNIIIHIPKNAIINANGQPVSDIDLKFAGFMDVAEALSSNVTTTTNNGLLNSSAIIYASFSKNGKELNIDQSKGIKLEIPDHYQRDSINVYRKESKDKNWQETNEQVYLNTVPFELLYFLPPGFDEVVKSELGTAFNRLASDSIYYAMEAYERREAIYLLDRGAEATKLLVWHKKLPYLTEKMGQPFLADSVLYFPTLTPAMVKVLKSQELAKTFIATKAFEERLQVLHQSGCYGKGLLDIYLQNLHQPLWVSDSIIFFHHQFDDPGLYEFEKFYRQKLTNTEGAPASSQSLTDWFYATLEQERAKISEEQKVKLQEVNKSWTDLFEKKAKLLEVKDELLRKREVYRMKRFGFVMTKAGWVNFASAGGLSSGSPVHIDDLEKFELEVELINGQEYTRTYAYIVNPEIFSLYAMQSDDKVHFASGFDLDRHLLMWEKQKALAVGIGIKNGKFGYDRKSWRVNFEKKNLVRLTLKRKEYSALKETLERLPLRNEENQITVDLEISEKIARQDSLMLLEFKEVENLERQLQKYFYATFPCDYPVDTLAQETKASIKKP